MKKTIALLIIVFMLAALCACSANQPALSSASPPTQPTPASGVASVFGKEVKIAVISNGDEAASSLFFAGAKGEAESMGIQIETVAAGKDFDAAVDKSSGEGANAIIAYLPNKAESYAALESAAQKGISISIFEMQKGSAPETISQTYYNPEKETDMALEAAMAYPPHDPPVRLIALFETKDGKTATAYQALVDAGKIFPKETYLAAGNDKQPKAWMDDKLTHYYAGMMDAVFAEDSKLAAAALDSLDAGKRDDMEVFSIGLSEEVLKRMQSEPEVYVQVVGANSAYAGKLNVRIALDMLKGHAPAKEELAPSLISAADLKDKEILTALGDLVSADLAGKYNETWMDELRNANKAK